MSTVGLASCPQCAAPRIEGPECPRCGIIYAKARQPPAAEQARAVAAPQAEPLNWQGDLEDAQLELWLRVFALPTASALAWLILSTAPGHFLARTFFTMMVHETGHAVTAWICGFPAFPLLWFTPIAEARSGTLIVLLTGALAFWVFWLWNRRRGAPALGVGLLLVFQLAASLLLRSQLAKAWIIFGGDAGCIVLGALLMSSFYSGQDSAIHRDWLRWGFIVLGAFAFMDAGGTWWRARSDVDVIPFGEIEGVGLSDPSQLTETYGWTVSLLVNRYTWLIVFSAAALVCLYAVQLQRAREQLLAARRVPPPDGPRTPL
jgi:hypothetical protein